MHSNEPFITLIREDNEATANRVVSHMDQFQFMDGKK